MRLGFVEFTRFFKPEQNSYATEASQSAQLVSTCPYSGCAESTCSFFQKQEPPCSSSGRSLLLLKRSIRAKVPCQVEIHTVNAAFPADSCENTSSFETRSNPMPCLDHELAPLLTRVRPRLTSVFATYRIPEEVTEDLLQDALVSLVSCWPTVREPDAWLVQTVRYLCYRYMRRERYGPCEHLDPFTLAERFPCPVQPPQELLELRLDLEALASTLPPVSRRALRLSLVEGWENAEAAEELGFRRESVRQNVRRSLKILKKEAADRLTFRGRPRKP